MPQIKEYRARTEVSGPTGNNRPADPDSFGALGKATAGLGRAISGVGDMLQEREEQQELSDLNSKLAKKHADYTNQWRETLRTADPGDTEIANRFNEKFAEDIGALRENVKTRKGELYFEKATADLKGHFLTTAMSGQAELAGMKAKQDAEGALNNYSVATFNDPAAFEMSRGMFGDQVETLYASKMLSRVQADEFKKQGERKIAYQAINGWINSAPEIAETQLKSGQWDPYLDGDTKNRLFGEIKQQYRARDLDADRVQREQERAKKEKSKGFINQFLVDLQAGKATAKQVLENHDLDPVEGPGSKRALLDMIDQAGKQGLKTDPGTFMSAFKRIHAPEDDPNRIKDENELNEIFMRGGLSVEGLNQLRNEFQGDNTEEGRKRKDDKKRLMEYAESKLVKRNPMIGFQDPEGQKQLKFFLDELDSQIAARKKEGKPYDDLLDPNSQDTMWNKVGKFTRSAQQIMKDQAETLRKKAELPPPAAADSGKVQVIAPDGTPGSIPKEKLSEALKRGYKVK
jgi:hypothetical protein